MGTHTHTYRETKTEAVVGTHTHTHTHTHRETYPRCVIPQHTDTHTHTDTNRATSSQVCDPPTHIHITHITSQVCDPTTHSTVHQPAPPEGLQEGVSATLRLTGCAHHWVTHRRKPECAQGEVR